MPERREITAPTGSRDGWRSTALLAATGREPARAACDMRRRVQVDNASI